MLGVGVGVGVGGVICRDRFRLRGSIEFATVISALLMLGVC